MRIVLRVGWRFHYRISPVQHVRMGIHGVSASTRTLSHIWNPQRTARCSVTTFILSTAQVRTCIGCTRKAFLPFSSLGSSQDDTSSMGGRGRGDRDFFPPAVRGSWFVEELLEAAYRCLFCGNAFVTVLWYVGILPRDKFQCIHEVRVEVDCLEMPSSTNGIADFDELAALEMNQ